MKFKKALFISFCDFLLFVLLVRVHSKPYNLSILIQFSKSAKLKLHPKVRITPHCVSHNRVELANIELIHFILCDTSSILSVIFNLYLYTQSHDDSTRMTKNKDQPKQKGKERIYYFSVAITTVFAGLGLTMHYT